MNIASPLLRGLLAGLIGGVAWIIGLAVFFMPVQSILADPDLQSAKMLAAFTADPPPRSAEAPWIVPVALLAIGALWGCVYVWIAGAWSKKDGAMPPWWGRGLRFAVVAWILMVPWFEFYLPWNVLREPLSLALLEAACWAGVMLLVGLAIAGVDAALSRPRPAAPQA